MSPWLEKHLPSCIRKHAQELSELCLGVKGYGWRGSPESDPERKTLYLNAILRSLNVIQSVKEKALSVGKAMVRVIF